MSAVVINFEAFRSSRQIVRVELPEAKAKRPKAKPPEAKPPEAKRPWNITPGYTAVDGDQVARDAATMLKWKDGYTVLQRDFLEQMKHQAETYEPCAMSEKQMKYFADLATRYNAHHCGGGAA